MNYDKQAELMDRIFKEVLSIRDAGQKEYARSTDDVHANFKRVGNWTDTDPKKVMLTYLIKHIDGICSYVNGHKSQREDVRGRITDTIVYLCLLWGYIDEEEEK